MNTAVQTIRSTVETCVDVTGFKLASFSMTKLSKRISKLVDITAYGNDGLVGRSEKEFKLSEGTADLLFGDDRQSSLAEFRERRPDRPSSDAG